LKNGASAGLSPYPGELQNRAGVERASISAGCSDSLGEADWPKCWASRSLRQPV